MRLLEFVWATLSTLTLLWRFRRVLWHGKSYFSDENADKNGPELKQMLIDSGPFYVKMGQWLSQRPDLLPRLFLSHLKTLQYNAPAHNFEHTMSALKRMFNASQDNKNRCFEEVFFMVDVDPIASGSIAQVHRVYMRDEENNSLLCVCKVRHPRVKELLERDLLFVLFLFNIGRWLNVSITRIVDVESIIAEMRKQCDLSTEVQPMQEFGDCFMHSPNFVFPKPISQYVSEEVIVETLVEGVRYDQLPLSSERTSIRDLCKRLTMGAYLRMVFIDGLIHGDCHGGNVLYNVKEKEKGTVDNLALKNEELEVHRTKMEKDEDMYQGSLPPETFSHSVQVAFVDFGVTGRVTEHQKHAFIELLSGAFSKDVSRFSKTVESLVVDMNGNNQLSDVQRSAMRQFEIEFKHILDSLDSNQQSTVGRMMNELLNLLQRYELRIDGNLVRILVNFILIEEDYGYAKYNNVFDNTLRYTIYNDEARDFDCLIEPFSDFMANHYSVRHGATAPLSRQHVGTDESIQSLQTLQKGGGVASTAAGRGRRVIKRSL